MVRDPPKQDPHQWNVVLQATTTQSHHSHNEESIIKVYDYTCELPSVFARNKSQAYASLASHLQHGQQDPCLGVLCYTPPMSIQNGSSQYSHSTTVGALLFQATKGQ